LKKQKWERASEEQQRKSRWERFTSRMRGVKRLKRQKEGLRVQHQQKGSEGSGRDKEFKNTKNPTHQPTGIIRVRSWRFLYPLD